MSQFELSCVTIQVEFRDILSLISQLRIFLDFFLATFFFRQNRFLFGKKGFLIKFFFYVKEVF